MTGVAGACGMSWTPMLAQVGQAVSLSSVQVACEKTVSAMQHVLQRTIRCAKGTCPPALPSWEAVMSGGGQERGRALPAASASCCLLVVRQQVAVWSAFCSRSCSVGKGREASGCIPPALILLVFLSSSRSRTEAQPSPAGAEDGPEQKGHRGPRDRRAGHSAVMVMYSPQHTVCWGLRFHPPESCNVCLRAMTET